MAQMGLGYGSEFQMMRFLGHHRNHLFKLIHDATDTNEEIKWLDYPYNDENLSGDGEMTGIQCFSHLQNYKEISAKWEKFWPQSGSSMNWDGIFTIGDTWYFVEAKAHRSESFQKCQATSEVSRNLIKQAFTIALEWLNVKNDIEWIETNCYQLANRLAFIAFCNKNGIKARLLYIGFVNGFRRKKDEIHSSDEWMKVWNEELSQLGITMDDIKSYIYFIHPDCNPDKDKCSD